VLITSYEINTYTRAIFKFFRLRIRQENYTFLKTHYAMWCHTGDICIWNKVEYLQKGASYQNSIKEIIKSF
jgi:hypothetical protein